VHTVVATAANVNDVTQAGALLHGQESVAFGDAGYRGVHKREEAQGPEEHIPMKYSEDQHLRLEHQNVLLITIDRPPMDATMGLLHHERRGCG
jgi:IS5 family transposase